MPSVSSPSNRIGWPHFRPSGKAAILTLLVILTSLAVGATTSPWLVPVYLLAMGWLLVGRPAATSASRENGGEPASRTTEGIAVASVDGITSEPVPDGEPELEKPKKPRRRPRAKPKIAESPSRTMTTWVQVGPGKFVRVDVAVTEDSPQESLEGTSAIDPAATVSESGGQDSDENLSAPDNSANAFAASSCVESPSSPDATPEGYVPAATEEHSTFDGISEGIIEHVPSTPDPNASTVADLVEWPVASPPFVVDDFADEETGDPPAANRFVVTCEAPRMRDTYDGRARSIRIRRDSRPKMRRGNGRVGSTPRVVLHRA